jgi:hypothetical protein
MTGCVAIARPYARRKPGEEPILAAFSGTPDLRFRNIAAMPAPSRQARKDTANAVGVYRPSGVQIPEPPQLTAPSPERSERGTHAIHGPRLQFGLQLPSSLAPQRLVHALARVLHLERGHVGVTLRCSHPRVAKDLLHHADVHALLDQQSGGSMPGVMDPSSRGGWRPRRGRTRWRSNAAKSDASFTRARRSAPGPPLSAAGQSRSPPHGLAAPRDDHPASYADAALGLPFM